MWGTEFRLLCVCFECAVLGGNCELLATQILRSLSGSVGSVFFREVGAGGQGGKKPG